MKKIIIASIALLLIGACSFRLVPDASAAGTFTTVGQNTTVDFSFTLPNAQMQANVDAITKQLVKDGGSVINWATLTNQQKVNMLNNYIKTQFAMKANVANIQAIADAQKIATDAQTLAAIQSAVSDTTYTLP